MAKAVKKITTLTGKLIIVQKLKRSLNGNPRYMCMINETVFYTRPNCGYGFMIKNYEGKEITAICSDYRGKLSLDKI
jgi:hypothetical protein